MRLSIIIPYFNAGDTIANQLEALANQNWSEPWEVIIADNGSPDGDLAALVEEYQERLPHLRIVDASNRKGAAYARNVGVIAAASDELAFCDADDEVAPGWVAAIGEALTKYDFVAGQLNGDKLNEPWILKTHQCPQQDGLQEYNYPPYLPHAAGANMGIKRSLHESIGGFDETMLRLHDTDYCWRLQLAGIDLNFVSEAVVFYRFRNTVIDMARQARMWGEYNVLLYKKYRSLGMSQLSWQDSLREWGTVCKRLPRIRNKTSFARWMWLFNWRMGRLKGSIKYRVWAL